MSSDRSIGDEVVAEAVSGALAEVLPDLEQRMAADPEALLDLVSVAAKAERHTAELLRSAVNAARAGGHSWEAIGARLGISRQAAQQRFGREQGDTGEGIYAGAGPDLESTNEIRVISGLTAFNEMRVVERVGRYGWHSIGYGMLHHVVRKSDSQWEHVRLPASSETVAQLMAEGWQRIGTRWFPWVYLKRRSDVPALVEEGGLGSSLGG